MGRGGLKRRETQCNLSIVNIIVSAFVRKNWSEG
jgi:hypothetical protein